MSNMQKYLKPSFGLGLLSLFVLLSWSCNRDKTIWDGDLYTSVDNTFAQSEFTSITNLIDSEARSDTNLYGKTAETNGFYCPAAQINVDVLGNNSARLTIDFGTGTNCQDGRLRTGILIATFDGKWKDQGARVTVTPQGYSVSGYAFSFELVSTMNGRDTQSGLLSWTTVVTNASLINPNESSQITWEGTRTTVFKSGEGDLNLSNNVYEITSTSSGTARNGRGFTAQTKTPLEVQLSCPNVVRGTVELTPLNLETRSIDYGQGACDGIAILTVGSFQTEINLR